MSRGTLTKSSADITAEAAAWIAQFETGELSPADIEAAQEWMSRSPRHAAEIRRLARLSAELNVLTAMAGSLEEAAARYRPIRRRQARLSWWTRTRWKATGAVTAFAIAMSAGILLLHFNQPTSTDPTRLTTNVGRYEEHTLTDGSMIALNTATDIEIEYTGKERAVRLNSGEAFFAVAHDDVRPFLVRAGGRSVEAVGTAFDVRVDTSIFQVTVTEGSVTLGVPSEFRTTESEAAGQHIVDEPRKNMTQMRSSARMQLTAGHTFRVSSVDDLPQVVAISNDAIRRQLAWRERRFDFSDASLEEVVREVNRHTTQKIRIVDPGLKSIRFGGVFAIDDTDTFLDTLNEAYQIEVVRAPDQILLMHKTDVGT